MPVLGGSVVVRAVVLVVSQAEAADSGRMAQAPAVCTCSLSVWAAARSARCGAGSSLSSSATVAAASPAVEASWSSAAT